jgi:hypothetical protein
LSDFEEQVGFRAKLQPVQDWRTTSTRTHHFLGKRTQRATDDLALGLNELLNAPGVYGWVWRTCLCEPSVCLLPQTFPGQASSKCSAECSSHQHGVNAERNCVADAKTFPMARLSTAAVAYGNATSNGAIVALFR